MVHNDISAIFRDFDPIENKMLKVIDTEGKVLEPRYLPDIDAGTIAEAYRRMLFERTADEMAVSYQRQGRMFTYTPNVGQEAIHAAAGMVIGKDDWLVPSFRELGILLAQGVTMRELFLFYLGNEWGGAFKNLPKVLPMAISIGTQMHHAVGIGYEVKYRQKKEVVFTFIGDGGTSEGDFSESLNFAKVWQAPVVFTIQNNQYAISVPVQAQTRSINLAVKSVAFGLPGIKVDGNDFFAMYLAYKFAADFARAGNGPLLIEAFTYRRGAHTTSDDPSKYREKEEEKRWEENDPLRRLKRYMQQQGIWEMDEQQLIDEYRTQLDDEFREAEKSKSYPIDDIFDYVFADKPEELKRQQKEYREFISWKEGRQ